jgi:hypothetical protein
MTCYMFRPYLTIFRQLFVFPNRHTALVLSSKYFSAYCISVVHTKIYLFGNVTLYPYTKVTRTRTGRTYGYILMGHIQITTVNNTPMFTGLNKTIHKTRTSLEENNVNFSNKYILVWTTKCNSIEIFWLKNWCSMAFSKSELLPEDGQIRPKHIAVDCDFNVILN